MIVLLGGSYETTTQSELDLQPSEETGDRSFWIYGGISDPTEPDRLFAGITRTRLSDIIGRTDDVRKDQIVTGQIRLEWQEADSMESTL